MTFVTSRFFSTRSEAKGIKNLKFRIHFGVYFAPRRWGFGTTGIQFRNITFTTRMFPKRISSLQSHWNMVAVKVGYTAVKNIITNTVLI